MNPGLGNSNREEETPCRFPSACACCNHRSAGRVGSGCCSRGGLANKRRGHSEKAKEGERRAAGHLDTNGSKAVPVREEETRA